MGPKTVAVSGQDQHGAGTHGHAGEEVAILVADHEGPTEIDSQLLPRPNQEPGLRLPARAGQAVPLQPRFGVVGAVVDPIQTGPLLGEQRAHAIMNLGQPLLVEQVVGHAGLVGRHDRPQPGPVGLPDRLGTARDQLHLIDLAEITHLLADRPVAIQQ